MATDAEKVKMYREKAKDTSIPQEVRNTYLDRANELERKAFEDTKKAPTPPTKLAKGVLAHKYFCRQRSCLVFLVINQKHATTKTATHAVLLCDINKRKLLNNTRITYFILLVVSVLIVYIPKAIGAKNAPKT